MARKPEIKRTADGQRPLFAKLSDEVVNGLNEFCLERQIDRRDDVLEHVLRRFLGTPRKPPKRARSVAEQAVSDKLPDVKEARGELDALDAARRHAEAIVEVTTIRRKKRTA